MTKLTTNLFSTAFSMIALLGMAALSGCASYGGSPTLGANADACSEYDGLEFPAKQNVARAAVESCEE